MKAKEISMCFVIGISLIILLPSVVNGNNFNEPDEYQIKLEYYHYEEYFSPNCPVYTENINKNTVNPVGSNPSSIFPENFRDGPMDSPWSMQSHDTHHTGRSPYSTENNPGTEKWRFLDDHWMDISPVIDNNGTIYISNSWGHLYAIYPNGTLYWEYILGGQVMGSSPAIDEDGTIYIGSWDCKLYAINPDGTEKWRFPSGGSIASSPAIAEDGTIYFGNFGEGIFAVNPNGTQKWFYDPGHDVLSDPVIGDDGTVYVGCWNGIFSALYPNGTLRWSFPTGGIIKGPASIAEDGTIYFGSYDDFLYALNPDGTEKWRIPIGTGTETNPSIGLDGTIYVGDDKLYAVYPNGTLKWSFNLGSNRRIHQSSPAISAEGTIYVGTNIGDGAGGEIIAVNSDGTERWRQRIADYWVDSSPSIAEDGTVYIGSAYDMGEGYLHAFGIGELEADAHGPYIGIINEPVQFTGSADGGYPPYSYHWDFGDEETSEEQNPTHEYVNPGNFTVTLTVTDDNDSVAMDTTWALIRESNEPPNTPSIDGETEGNYGEPYDYTFITTDLDGDDVWHYIEWGDNSNSGWLGPYNSGEEVVRSHTWDEQGDYTIRAKARDIFEAESDWGTLEVTMPMNRQSSIMWFLRFLERFPHAFPTLRYLLGL